MDIHTISTDKYNLPIRYGSEMRVLIVGGGIAGLALAGLLQQRGFKPSVVEKAPEYSEVGYVIVLWPSGSRVFKGLGLYRELLDIGLQFNSYNVADEGGRILHSYSVKEVVDKYGPMLNTYRPDLINVLREAVDPDNIKMGTTIDNLVQTNDEVYVTLSDGTQETYDLVIGCDGVRSKTRQLIFGDVPLSYSGMKGWSFWVDNSILKEPQIAEYWGTGKFIGIWPTKGRMSVFTSIRSDDMTPEPADNRIERIRDSFKSFGGLVPQVLSGLEKSDQIFHDHYYDLKIDSWYKGRVVLVGDAAHAILPTAGGGVSMAIESAAVLADELSRADTKYLGYALENYVTKRRDRVGSVQDKSRMMGKIAYANNPVVAALRDYAFRFYSNRLHLKYWDSMLKHAI